jgi:hypothetical protein
MDHDQSSCSFLKRALKGGQRRRHRRADSLRGFRFYQPQLGVWAWNKEVYFQILLIAKIVEVLAHPTVRLINASRGPNSRSLETRIAPRGFGGLGRQPFCSLSELHLGL